MTKKRARTSEELKQAWTCAYKHFVEGMSYSAIAKKLGRNWNRTKVAKVIEQIALKQRFFRVVIANPYGYSTMENELASKYPLTGVKLIPSVTGDYKVTARCLGELAASYFEQLLKQEENGRALRIGIAGGLTIHETIQAMVPDQDPAKTKLEIYPLVFGPIPDNLTSAGANAGLMASKYGPDRATSFDLWQFSFPKNVPDVNMIGLTKAKTDLPVIDLALVGIGSLVRGSTLDRNLTLMGFSLAQLQASNVVGDLCSSLLDKNGEVINPPELNRIIAITPDQLRRLHRRRRNKKQVIAVAGGEEKIKAIKAVLLGGGTIKKPKPYVTHLVTDETVAKALLQS